MSGPVLSGSGTTVLSTVLSTRFQPDITEGINRATPLPQLLPVLPADGQNYQWVHAVSDSSYTNGAVADGATVSVYNSDVKIPMVLQYCTYMDAVAVGGRAQTLAELAGSGGLQNLVSREIKEGLERLAQKVAVAFYTGTGAANQLQGMYSTTGTTYGGLMATGIYAGQDRSMYAELAGNALTNGGIARPLTQDLMRDMRRTIYTASGLRPDLIVCDPLTHEYFGKTFGAQRLYMQDVFMRGQKIVLEGGYHALNFDGIPVIEDVNHPAGKMSFLNTSQIEIRHARPVMNPLNQYVSEYPLAGSVEEQFGQGNLKLSGHIKALAPAGDVTPLELLCYLQFIIKRPNSMGYIGDLLTT